MLGTLVWEGGLKLYTVLSTRGREMQTQVSRSALGIEIGGLSGLLESARCTVSGRDFLFTSSFLGSSNLTSRLFLMTGMLFLLHKPCLQTTIIGGRVDFSRLPEKSHHSFNFRNKEASNAPSVTEWS